MVPLYYITTEKDSKTYYLCEVGINQRTWSTDQTKRFVWVLFDECSRLYYSMEDDFLNLTMHVQSN